jgi:predicted SAM-dependent methyltransferase
MTTVLQSQLSQPNLTSKYLHLGCGLNTPENWLNVDGSLQVIFAKKRRLKKVLTSLKLYPQQQAEIPWSTNILHHDLRKPLPFADGQFVAVYSSHTLEHLFRSEAIALVHECFRVLGPGGVCRLVVPDIAAIIQHYLKTSQMEDANQAADQFMDALLSHPSSPRHGLLGLYHTLLGFHQHKWMYDAASLSKLLTDAGFIEITNPSWHEGNLPDLKTIEDPDRIRSGAGVVVEGIKP